MSGSLPNARSLAMMLKTRNFRYFASVNMLEENYLKLFKYLLCDNITLCYRKCFIKTL